jgi:hypothetical protein
MLDQNFQFFKEHVCLNVLIRCESATGLEACKSPTLNSRKVRLDHANSKFSKAF